MTQPAQSSGHEWQEWATDNENRTGHCECGLGKELGLSRPQYRAHVASVAQAAQPQEVPAEQRDENAWLIEKGLLCLGFCEYRFRWVTFTDENALRLCREVDAYALRETLKYEPFKMFDQLANTTISEHLWPAPAQPASAAKPAEDGLEAQLRACIRYTAARLRDEHEDLEEDIYAAVLNFIYVRERELREKLEGWADKWEIDAPPAVKELRALLASHWPAQKEGK